jgi:hypothetical protein
MLVIIFVVVFCGMQLYRRWRAEQTGPVAPNYAPNQNAGAYQARAPSPATFYNNSPNYANNRDTYGDR